jgi:hypothetical protein
MRAAVGWDEPVVGISEMRIASHRSTTAPTNPLIVLQREPILGLSLSLSCLRPPIRPNGGLFESPASREKLIQIGSLGDTFVQYICAPLATT